MKITRFLESKKYNPFSNSQWTFHTESMSKSIISVRSFPPKFQAPKNLTEKGLQKWKNVAPSITIVLLFGAVSGWTRGFKGFDAYGGESHFSFPLHSAALVGRDCGRASSFLRTAVLTIYQTRERRWEPLREKNAIGSVEKVSLSLVQPHSQRWKFGVYISRVRDCARLDRRLTASSNVFI